MTDREFIPALACQDGTAVAQMRSEQRYPCRMREPFFQCRQTPVEGAEPLTFISLPLLLDLKGPIKLQMGVIIIIHEL